MYVLGIETSCDETAIGIVDGERNILADLVASQLAQHRPYGGVVPEIAARAHLEILDDLIRGALKKARLNLKDLSAVAATCGPGLIGGVMVGAMMAKAMAAVNHQPFIAVNHLEAHALTARLSHNVDFPYLLLLVSGGHSQLLVVRDVSEYTLLGSTIDDAVGECFDKGAKLLGLGFPGGPLLEKAAFAGDPFRFNLPRPMLGREGCSFSFSGLKTALRQLVDKQTADEGRLSHQFIADAAASMQQAIADILVDRTRNALQSLEDSQRPITALVTAGGVAANGAVRSALTKLVENIGLPFVAPPLALCTDNGVMVAWAGLERYRKGFVDGLDVAARPRWPLENLSHAIKVDTERPSVNSKLG